MVFDRNGQAYPDTLVGTDSHTTMVNGLGVLGWGVGGIEAEAAMLGQPVSMLIPRVVGFKLHGELPAGATATDLVLTITEMLRKHGVVGKFVEFYGAGVGLRAAGQPRHHRQHVAGVRLHLRHLPDRRRDAVLPRLTGRPAEQLALVEAYAKAQGLWHEADHEPSYSEYLELDLATVVPSIAGPKRPQDRVVLSEAKHRFAEALPAYAKQASTPTPVTMEDGSQFVIDNGAVVIASITSCTNTSNPQVMIGAALLAKNAVEKGLHAKPWVKTTLAPGSKVVTNYYERAGLPPTWTSSASTSSATAASPASATAARCPSRSARPSTTPTCRWSRCCPATATSRAGSTRT